MLRGALERGCLVLSSPILSGLFSALPFPFLPCLLASCPLEANRRDAALMEGRTPGELPRREPPSTRGISMLQRDCFSGERGESPICLQMCVLERGKIKPWRLAEPIFSRSRAREVVAQIGASPANCIDKIMKVFVCTCSCCV